MHDVITEVAGIRMTVKLAAAGISLLVLILFAVLWLLDLKKRAGKSIPFGAWINGIGFGLLPAIAVWKAFEDYMPAAKGTEVIEPLPLIPWLTGDGVFMPCRIELAAALICFTGICLWLILRKEDLPDRGDLLLVALCLWAAVRIITVSFRPDIDSVYRYVCCGLILSGLVLWTVRRARIRPGAGRIAADFTAEGLCFAMIVVTTEGVLSAGSTIGDLAAVAGCAVLAAALALIAGGDSRKTVRASSD